MFLGVDLDFLDAANTELTNIELAEDRRRSLDCFDFDASFALFMDVNLSVIIFWYMLVVVVVVVVEVLAVPFKEKHDEQDIVSVQTAAVAVAAAGRREEAIASPVLTEDS